MEEGAGFDEFAEAIVLLTELHRSFNVSFVKVVSGWFEKSEHAFVVLSFALHEL